MKQLKKSSLGLPVIKCRCGAKILLLPNAKLMGEAIESHVKEHKTKLKGNKAAEHEADLIGDDLIMQVISKVCTVKPRNL